MENRLCRVFWVLLFEGSNKVVVRRDENWKATFKEQIHNHCIWSANAFFSHQLNHVTPMKRLFNDIGSLSFERLNKIESKIVF
jgi:hypothetical protein